MTMKCFLEKNQVFTEDLNAKVTSITTLYNEHENRNYLEKLLIMPSWKAWVQRPCGLIKRGRKKSANVQD
jgi:hypothetical protein